MIRRVRGGRWLDRSAKSDRDRPGSDKAVPWTKPQDLPFDSQQPTKGLVGPYPGGFWAAFCDGHAQWIALPEEADKVKALMTRNGREQTPPGDG